MAKPKESRRTAAQMHALAAVRREIGARDPIPRSAYLREFTEAYREYDAVLLPDQLDQQICSADVVLVGDYHALPASQQFTADLLEKCAASRPVVLAVEAILARDQPILDTWWRREIPADELRRRLRFDRDWGYAWGPFFELLNTARDYAQGIYGLDCMPRNNLRKIRSRDRHAAAKIREVRERHPKALIVVLFGESHLAPQHLPRALHQALPGDKILSVLQNVDSLYWAAVAQKAEAVSIGENAICVFNSSPLEKYESYRLCLEQWKSTPDEAQDFAPAIYNLILSLARALGFRLDSPRNGTQPKFLTDSLPEIVALDGSIADLASADLPPADQPLEDRSCIFLPDSNSFLIREFKIAEAAEECARFLHFACRGMTPVSQTGKPIEDALACFGRRLLCPELARAEADSTLGDLLYQTYLDSKISPRELRQIFLSRLETGVQADQVLEQIRVFLPWVSS